MHRDIKLNNFVCTAADDYTHPDTSNRLAHRQATTRKLNKQKSMKSQIGSSQNDEPEDDGVISLIDYGISKKVLLPSEQKRLDEIKVKVGGPI